MTKISCFFLALGLFLAGCSKNPVSNSSSSATQDPQVVFQIEKSGGSVTSFSLEDLNKLAKVQITAGGSTQEGPRLKDVLRAAGVSDYMQVTLDGSNGTITLSHEQIDDGVILDFNNRGSVKLASANIPKDQWIKDINRIKVE